MNGQMEKGRHNSRRKAQVISVALNYRVRFAAVFVVSLLVAALCHCGIANAAQLADVPAQLRVKVAAHDVGLDLLPRKRLIFGSTERSSSKISPFTKWTSMFQRLNYQVKSEGGALASVREQVAVLQAGAGGSLYTLASGVNDLMNQQRYVTDAQNYGRGDYWSTLPEFLARGGDCEDFAIAKYTALRMAGVSDDVMRIAIVQDTWKNIAHAVLVVYTERGPYVLDNQNKELASAASKGRYRPIFSINRSAWWLHKQPVYTQVASLR